ncbi:MAG: hypothetical protein KBT11_08615 [Treponema sp.]|nr:hypothetical protein [Candidatus Treponema equifaecale]
MKVRYFDNKTLKSFNPLLAYPGVCINPRSIFTNFRTFAVIIKEFFFLQFFEKLHIIHIPIVHVDHPLDQKIPFTPSKVRIYLDFINLWVRPLTMLISKFGCWHASLLCKKWMRIFRRLYIAAGQIYHFRLTTTDRPKYKDMLEFRQIHALDPHFLCVPSLHIATVALAFGFYRRTFAEEDFSEAEIKNWSMELYDGAVEIAETVLYVKQHSVNCIPAALYMVTANFGDLFSVEDARKFIDDMFNKPEGFSEVEAFQVKDHIRTAFENYLKEGEKSENWYEPVHKFLENYEKEAK